MRDHRHPAVRLDAYADGELDQRQRRRVAAHLVECADCRVTLGFDRIIAEALDEPTPTISHALVRATCDRAFGARWPLVPLWWLSLPTSWRVALPAMLMLAALAGFHSGRSRPDALSEAQRLANLLEAPEIAAMTVALHPDNGGRQ